MSRPNHLPDFANPPLNEVVLGVQFAPPPGYQHIFALDVWNLFKEDFPSVQEQPPLAPTFETFGTTFAPPLFPQLTIGFGGANNRYWFVSAKQDELIQFQSDRLLHNWRKLPIADNNYPRFETIIRKFETELAALQGLFASYGAPELGINQCELSYINHIYDLETKAQPNPTDWFNFLAFTDPPDDFAINFRKTLLTPDGKPIGRIIVEAANAIDTQQRRLINFTLTVRGAPQGTRIENALDFLRFGRDHIVARFKELTTSSAHSLWEIQP